MSNSNRVTLIITYLLSVLLLVLSFRVRYELGMSTAVILLWVNSCTHIIIEELAKADGKA